MPDTTMPPLQAPAPSKPREPMSGLTPAMKPMAQKIFVLRLSGVANVLDTRTTDHLFMRPSRFFGPKDTIEDENGDPKRRLGDVIASNALIQGQHGKKLHYGDVCMYVSEDAWSLMQHQSTIALAVCRRLETLHTKYFGNALLTPERGVCYAFQPAANLRGDEVIFTFGPAVYLPRSQEEPDYLLSIQQDSLPANSGISPCLQIFVDDGSPTPMPRQKPVGVYAHQRFLLLGHAVPTCFTPVPERIAAGGSILVDLRQGLAEGDGAVFQRKAEYDTQGDSKRYILQHTTVSQVPGVPADRLILTLTPTKPQRTGSAELRNTAHTEKQKPAAEATNESILRDILRRTPPLTADDGRKTAKSPSTVPVDLRPSTEGRPGGTTIPVLLNPTPTAPSLRTVAIALPRIENRLQNAHYTLTLDRSGMPSQFSPGKTLLVLGAQSHSNTLWQREISEHAANQGWRDVPATRPAPLGTAPDGPVLEAVPSALADNYHALLLLRQPLHKFVLLPALETLLGRRSATDGAGKFSLGLPADTPKGETSESGAIQLDQLGLSRSHARLVWDEATETLTATLCAEAQGPLWVLDAARNAKTQRLPGDLTPVALTWQDHLLVGSYLLCLCKD